MKGSPKPEIQSKIKDTFDYDPISGNLIWKQATSTKVKVGSIAGFRQFYGHMEVGLSGQRFMVHHIAWFLTHNVWPDVAIKHRNGNKSDNSITNLEISNFH